MDDEQKRFTAADAWEVMHGAAAIAMGLGMLNETGEYPKPEAREWWMAPGMEPVPDAVPLAITAEICSLLDQPGTMNAEALYTTYVHWMLKGPAWTDASPAIRRTFDIVVACWPALRKAVELDEAAAAEPKAAPKERANLKKGGRRLGRGGKTGGKAADKTPVAVKLADFSRPAETKPARKGGRFQKKGG